MDAFGRNLISRVKAESNYQDRIAGLALALISFALLMALTAAWPTATHDGRIHFHRIRAVADALQAGVLYPRWFPDYAFDHGYPVLNYYPPAFYFPPAVLNLAGLDLVASVRLSLSIGFAFSAWWMFHLTRQFVSLWPAVAGVICFQFFPYRMIDLFERGAFPELVAFIWLPPIALYSLQAGAAYRSRERGGGSKNHADGTATHLPPLVGAALAWAALVATHTLTALMAALVFGFALALIALFQLRERGAAARPILIVLGAFAIGSLITAWHSLPVLLEVAWVIVGQGFTMGAWMNYFAGWIDLVEFDLTYSYSHPESSTFFLPLYIVPIGIGASIGTAAASKSRRLRLFTLVTLLLVLGAVWLTTSASAWLWTGVDFLLGNLQFPWRWQTMIAFGVALLLAACLEPLRGVRRLPTFTMPLLTLALSAYIFLYAVARLDYPTDDMASYRNVSAQTLWRMNAQIWERNAQGKRVGSWAREYTPIWVEADHREMWAIPTDSFPVPDAIASMEVAPTRAGLLQWQFRVTTQEAFRLLFHQFYFPPWRATIDGVQADVEPAGKLALASVEIPPGTHTVEFGWAPTGAVRLGRVVTAIGWVVVFALLYRAVRASGTTRRGAASVFLRLRQNWPVLTWGAVGALMVVVSSGITARVWDIAAIGADYGNIRLEGVRLPPPTRAGETARVQLMWTVTGPGEPVSAFVHLVDESGMGVSQHDGPPGGEYTPYQRWEPGLLLRSMHNILLPHSLPPGKYRLIAGLYVPDISHEPLAPRNGDNPRLEIGAVEVVP